MYNANLTINPMMEEDNVKVKPLPVTQKRGFRCYKDLQPTTNRSRPYKQSMLKNASINYLELIEKIDPKFESDQVYIPRRTLTNPREPSKNHGYDNINDDYILVVNDILGDVVKYEILDLMGQGTFGQVVKCKVNKTGELVAVKVIKRQPAFLMQGEKEVNILIKLKDQRETQRFLQMKDYFYFRGHLCIVFELLSISLHGLFSQQIKKPHLSIKDIQKISINILETLALLKEMRIIHTDLKPDNILLKSLDDIHNVKLIDYGSALVETEKLNYCVQTAFYRSPEVILQVAFGCAIDMWSFGCFVAEMYLGRPLFPSGNEAVLLEMMTYTLGSLPPDSMLKRGHNASKFFHVKGTNGNTTQTKLRVISQRTHDSELGKNTLRDRIMGYKSNDDSEEDDDSMIDNFPEMESKELLYDFLKDILVFEPLIRKTPQEALRHPFITSAIKQLSPSNSSAIDNDSGIPMTNNNVLPLSPVAIYESLLANSSLSNNLSSINTSRTTEDSLEIKTPPNTLQINRKKDKRPLTPSKSPRIIITSPSESSKKASPQSVINPKGIIPKGILKKREPDYTLDSRVALIHEQPRPDSTLSNTSASREAQKYMQQMQAASPPQQQPNTSSTMQQQHIVHIMRQQINQQQKQALINKAIPLIYQQQQQQLKQRPSHFPVQQPNPSAYPNRLISPLQHLNINHS